MGGRNLLRNGVAANIVAVKRNIEGAGVRNEIRGDRGERRAQPAGEFNPAIGNSEQEKWFAVAMPLENGVGEPLNRGPYFFRADRLMFGHEAPFWRRAHTW